VLKVSALAYARENRTLFSNITFDLKPGSALLISGSNGKGKSSLLKILAGLWPAASGLIIWRGQKVQPGDPLFLAQLLYQGHSLGLDPLLSPLENLKWRLSISGMCLRAVQDKIPFALEMLGLQGLENTPCEYLSKGQVQRVALARLWLEPPILWLLDEPFTALDKMASALLQTRMVEHVNHGGILIIASHHNIEESALQWQHLALDALGS
jgi:heme exporter protein A